MPLIAIIGGVPTPELIKQVKTLFPDESKEIQNLISQMLAGCEIVLSGKKDGNRWVALIKSLQTHLKGEKRDEFKKIIISEAQKTFLKSHANLNETKS